MLALAALLAVHAGLAGSIPTAPENITVTFLTPTSVRVSWQTSMDPHTMPVDKYDVTYKPTDASYRVVVVVAGNRDAVTLGGLTPDTQYQLTVAAVWNGKKYRSRPIVFRTLEPPRTSYQQDSGSLVGSSGPPNSPHADTAPSLSGIGIFTEEFGNISVNSTSRELPTIRGVEIGIVVLVLIVWAGAIALFFNRWGKIRMLLPYQPDYKQEQLKVPGTGVCANGTCNGQHSHQDSEPGLERFTMLHFQTLRRWMYIGCVGKLKEHTSCIPRCDSCSLLDRCFQCPLSRHSESRECGCQFALLHRADTDS